MIQVFRLEHKVILTKVSTLFCDRFLFFSLSFYIGTKEYGLATCIMVIIVKYKYEIIRTNILNILIMFGYLLTLLFYYW